MNSSFYNIHVEETGKHSAVHIRYLVRLAVGTIVLFTGTDLLIAGDSMRSGYGRSVFSFPSILSGLGAAFIIYSLFIFFNVVKAPGILGNPES